MTSIRKEVRISGKDDGLTDIFTKLQRQAEQLSKGLIQDAVKYSQSGKEQLKYLEDQIKAIERRNKLDAEGRRLSIEQRYGNVVSTPGTTEFEVKKANQVRKNELSQIDREEKQDQLQVRLLQDIVDSIKETSKEEILEDRRSSEKEVRLIDKQLSKGKDVDSETALKASVKRMLLGDSNESESEERRKFNLARAGRGFNTAAALGTQQNEIFMAAAALAMIPIVGQGISMVAQKLIGEGTQLAEARNLSDAITGIPISGIDVSSLGYDQAKFFGFSGRLARSRGSAALSESDQKIFGGSLDQSTAQLLATSRAYGIDEGTILNLAGAQRFDRNKRGTFGDIQNQIEIFRKAGAFGTTGQDMSRLIELLQIQNQLTLDQSQLMETVNTDTNSNIIAAFNNLGGSFADSRAGARISTVNQALINPQGDFKQAFNYSVLRKLNPNASFFELLEQREKGIASPKVLGETMRAIRKRGGSRDSQMLQMMQFFGLSAEQTRTLFQGFEEDSNMFDNLNETQKQELGLSPKGVIELAQKRTSPVQSRTAAMTDLYAEAGEKILDVADQYMKRASEFFNTDMKESSASLGTLNGTVKELNTTFENLTDKISSLFGKSKSENSTKKTK